MRFQMKCLIQLELGANTTVPQSSVPLGFDQREALDTIGVGQLVISSPGQTNPPPFHKHLLNLLK